MESTMERAEVNPEIEKLYADIQKLQLETMTLVAEKLKADAEKLKLVIEMQKRDIEQSDLDTNQPTLAEIFKLSLQTRWFPMIEGAGLLGIALALIKLYVP